MSCAVLLRLAAAPPAAVALLALAWAPLSAAEPAGWPQLGGPQRNWVSPATGVIGGGPLRLREAWRRPVEEGLAGIVVAGDRLVTLGTAEGQAAVFAVEAATGKDLWRRPLGASPPEPQWAAASTPATDGRRVFVVSPSCRLLALEAADGSPVWERDLAKEFNTGAIAGGCVTSPLLAGDLLVVQVNGEPDKRIVAFEPATGAVRWSSPGVARAVETSPAVMELGGVRQVVVHDTLEGRGGVHGFRLADGALLWSLRFQEGLTSSTDLPLPLGGDRVGMITSRSFRTLQVRARGGVWSAEPLWATTAIDADTFAGQAVVVGGQVYGMSRDFLTCLDAATGEVLWKHRTYQASLAAVDGHLLLLSQVAGLLRVVEASPGGYREKAGIDVFNPGAVSETPPAFAGRRIYLRNAEEMVAVELVR